MAPALASLLQENLSVEAVEDGLVAVTVVLPPDLVQDYCQFLESLASFFKIANRKSSSALSEFQASCGALERRAQKNIAEYRARIVTAFDDYTAQGLERQDAIKRVAADLRAASHPWCTLDVVRSELVAAGRGARRGRPRRSVK